MKMLNTVKASRLPLIFLITVFLSCEGLFPIDSTQIQQRRSSSRSGAGTILFISYHVHRSTWVSQPQLYGMNENGTDIKQITNDSGIAVTDAKWSPDGSKIAFRNDRHVYVMDADGNGNHLIVQPTFEAGGNSWRGGPRLVWSPDSKQLAYDRQLMPEDMGAFDVFAIKIDGSNERRMTHGPTIMVSGWSPDGKELLGDVTITERDSSGHIPWGTKIVIFDTLGNQIWTWGKTWNTIHSVIYSTDGGRVAFASSNPKYGGQGIYVIEAFGDTATLIVTKPDLFYQPISWSTDNRKILCNSGTGTEYTSILIFDVQTKQIIDITPFQNDTTHSHAVSWRKQ